MCNRAKLVTVLHKPASPVAGHERKDTQQHAESGPNSEKHCPQMMLEETSIGQCYSMH